MILSSEDISQRIINFPAPILFLDTCIFLDILRSPYRDNIRVETIASALKLIAMSEHDPCIVWLLTSEVSHGEWIDNIVNVKQELEREVKKLEHIREKLVTAADVTLGMQTVHGQKMTSLNLHSHLENLSHNFLNHCLLIKQEDSHSVKAMHRVQKCLAPAKKGKPEPKDCLIFEVFLEISEKVRNLGYTETIYFVTSNSNDYGKPKSPLIIEELNKVNAVLIDNLPWVLNAIQKIAKS